MANNRLYLMCKKCENNKNSSILLAKFYPSGGAIAGESAGWFTQYDDLSKRLDNFFEKHKHGFDFNMWGGYQYDIRYEIIGDNTDPKEQIINIISKSTNDINKK